jgi:hypothetical protein
VIHFAQFSDCSLEEPFLEGVRRSAAALLVAARWNQLQNPFC